MINPDVDKKSYAVEVGDDSILSDDGLAPDENMMLANSTNGDDNPDEGIMTLANVNPSLGLAVTNSDKVIETVQGGNTAYSDHLVTITGTEVTNYTLSMSSSSSNLTKPSGTSGANITGAAGATGNAMPANRWGYNVTEEGTSNSSYGGLTYSTVPTSTTTIANGNAGSDNTLNVKKKIVIAAKFGEDAAPGTYRQTINLSAVANATTVTFKITYNSNGGGTAPNASTQNSMENSVSFTLPGQGSMSKSGYKFVGWSTNQNATSGSAAGSTYTVTRTQPEVVLYAVWVLIPLGEWSNGVDSGITNMQDVNTGFCRTNNSVPTGSTVTLKDNRAGSASYKIMKMGDGKCWMVENLKLPGRAVLTNTNSDVTSSYTLPANAVTSSGTISGWGETPTAQNMAEGSTNMKAEDGKWKPAYGNYYSWCTATAGTCTNSGDAPSSICPKGWKLPSNANTTIGTYTALNTAYSGAWENNITINSTTGYSGRRIGYNAADAFFPAAGSIGGLNDINLVRAGGQGHYWSSTPSPSSVKVAYRLYFYYSGNIDPANLSLGRSSGYSVRCVASY